MSPKPKKVENELTFGKFILDSLSMGMYSHPLMSLREYIQNSTDAIDCLPSAQQSASIEIVIDGRTRSLTIHDDGIGVPSHKVKGTLLNIGCSEKDPAQNRGFRGIGRLGGLGYCDELRFITKSRGESIISFCTWDCKKLRQLIADPCTSIDTESLIKTISLFKQQKYPSSLDDHFFTVKMNMVHGGRNDLLNVPAIRSYLSQIAPVPFHPDFYFGRTIDKELTNRVASYKTYHISVNGQQIFKPYRDDVSLSKGTLEAMKRIDFVELQGESGILGFGWLGNLSLQGIVSASTDMDGLRLRCGNILIGNKDTLSGFFRERRFNNYLVGEIHVIGNELIPNSRRDDFEESVIKDDLYNTFIREIGIPFSRKIRYLSNERGKAKSSINLEKLLQSATRIINYGYISELQREHIIKNLRAVNGRNPDNGKQLAEELIQGVLNSQPIRSVLRSQRRSDDDIADLFVKALEIIYSETLNPAEAEKIAEKLYQLIFDESIAPRLLKPGPL